MKKVLIIFVLILLCGCTKKSIDSTEFKKILRDNDFYVINSISQFSEYDYIKESLVANNNNYQIEFYVLSDKDNALAFYNLNRDEFEIEDTNNSIEINKENNSKYELSTIDNYMYLSRIDNTVLYINVPIEYKENVLKIIKKLGY